MSQLQYKDKMQYDLVCYYDAFLSPTGGRNYDVEEHFVFIPDNENEFNEKIQEITQILTAMEAETGRPAKLKVVMKPKSKSINTI